MSNYEKIWPKTLVLRATAAEDSLIYVLGGVNEDIFVASFVDRGEAEAFVMASRQFGQEMVGVKQNGATRVEGGVVPEGSGGDSGGSVREVQGVQEG